MYYTIRTDMKKYVLALNGNSGNIGIARLTEDDNFDIAQGAKVALFRMFLDPSTEYPLDYDVDSSPGYEIELSVDQEQLRREVVKIAKWMGYCYARAQPVRLWKLLEMRASVLYANLSISG